MVARQAAGWEPYPLHSFVLKVHSRCDLACDYCYMYRSHDQSWRTQPRAMPPAVVDRTAERIAEHLSAHGLREAGVVLHGGEPLLIGDAALARTARVLRAAAGDGVRLHLSLQTNGVRLTRERLDLCAESGIRVGVSTDGGRAAHDRHRRGADGRGSHARVEAALELFASAPYRPLFAGLLCTIDLRNDPVHAYEALLSHRPPAVDFLLPLGNWHTPPPGIVPGGQRTPYADWLWAVFKRWYEAPVRETGVRLLDDVMTLLLGGDAHTESLGLAPVRYAVVESDGSLAQDDALRTAYDGAARTGLDVWRDSFDTLLRHPGIAARQWGADGLCAACRACPLHRVCGGGHYATRYRRATGFANPSVYCADLASLIRRVRGRLAQDVAELTTAAEGAAGGTGGTDCPVPSDVDGSGAVDGPGAMGGSGVTDGSSATDGPSITDRPGVRPPGAPAGPSPGSMPRMRAEGRTYGRTHGRTDGPMDGRTDGQAFAQTLAPAPPAADSSS
ncbi:FxsB family cyclophane-forming radical SAM/SPASM peptide maturase [Streptosporangium nondiastaticum]|uniref:FxsB family cyclophane-forming radical SAM/SPASM peptide maturase n=1 Tax=Streptosporangium nondiastaticum TaxID=35764 RepID=UPI001CB8AA8D|nr:FxsB family cyclophane-forming radical SAM/SPASM peptide maturase [Streptosporangium nondiastaticum]